MNPDPDYSDHYEDNHHSGDHEDHHHGCLAHTHGIVRNKG